MTDLQARAGEALERQLDRYARVRLDPSHAQVKRARSTVMEAAWRRRIGAPASPPSPAPRDTAESSVVGAAMTVLPTSHRRRRTRSRGVRRDIVARRIGVSFVAAVVAGVTIGTSVFAASRAGGPLYEARVGLEELALPAGGDARLEAALALAEGRLTDIVEAAERDDAHAVRAAVRAYLTSLGDLDESIGGLVDRALIAIEAHRVVLLRVLGEAPEQARTGLQNALVQSGTVVARLGGAASPGIGGSGDGARSAGPGAGAGDAGGGGGEGAGGTGGSGGTGSGATGDKPTEPGSGPAKTARPARTPPPVRVERPEPKPPQGGRP